MSQDSREIPQNPKHIKKNSIIDNPNSDYNLSKKGSSDPGITDIILAAADNLKEKIETLKQIAEKAKQDSITDSLTGCFSRKCWEDFVNKEFNPGLGEEVTIILFDINNLGETNNKNGHQAGDLLVQKTANYIKDTFTRNGDMTIRYGGDEFIQICRYVGDKEKFITRLESKFSKSNQEKEGISVAFGYAHFDKNLDEDGLFISSGNKYDNKKRKTTFERADFSMYKNKIDYKK